ESDHAGRVPVPTDGAGGEAVLAHVLHHVGRLVQVVAAPGGPRGRGQRGQGVSVSLRHRVHVVQVQRGQVWGHEGGWGVVVTSIVVPKDVVALLGEGELVHRVSDVAGLEQVAGVLARVAPVREALHVAAAAAAVRRTYKSVGDGDLEPHPVPDFQARVGLCHGLHDRTHLCADRQVHVIETWHNRRNERIYGRGGGRHVADGRGAGSDPAHVLLPHGSRVGHPGRRVDGAHGLLPRHCEVALGVRIPTLGHHKNDGAGEKTRNFPQSFHCVVVAHVLKADPVDLQDHVSRLDTSVLSNGAP
ncbi:hypothetical protein EGW08_001996, partial [Elysia chlorotica]